MPVTWKFTITPRDVSRKEATVVAVRTDDADPQNVLTETHGIDSIILGTADQKTSALNQIWQQHLDEQAKQTVIDGYLSGLEATAEANLEARE